MGWCRGRSCGRNMLLYSIPILSGGQLGHIFWQRMGCCPWSFEIGRAQPGCVFKQVVSLFRFVEEEIPIGVHYELQIGFLDRGKDGIALYQKKNGGCCTVEDLRRIVVQQRRSSLRAAPV